MDEEFPSRKSFPSRAHRPFSPDLPLGANANSDIKCKPLLLCTADYPRAVKNAAKFFLHVILKSHGRAWPMYCAEKSVGLRIISILDDASACASYMTSPDNPKMFDMPPRTPLTQPVDQVVFSALKSITYAAF